MRFIVLLFLVLFFPAFAFADVLKDGTTAFHNRDYQTSLKLLQPLAEQGSAEAQYDIGHQYLAGWGVKSDKAEGLNWIRKAANQGYAPAEVEVGQWYRESVCKGDVIASSCSILPQHDDAEAKKWFRKAADQGYPEAEYLISGTDEEGMKWLHKSAEHGYAFAQYFLGLHYAGDHGPYHNADPSDAKPDYAEAIKWLRMAAEQNFGNAQKKLGEMYEKGEGVKQDYVHAYMWYGIVPDASWGAGLGEKLYDKMTPEQRTEANRLIVEWNEKHALPPASVDYNRLRVLGGNGGQ